MKFFENGGGDECDDGDDEKSESSFFHNIRACCFLYAKVMNKKQNSK